jgi:hypothetical protein
VNDRDVTLFVGAEGVAELEGQPWIREATEEEIVRLRAERQPKDDAEWESLFLDGVGRPYFLMTVLKDAPEEVWRKASSHLRVLRLTR